MHVDSLTDQQTLALCEAMFGFEEIGAADNEALVAYRSPHVRTFFAALMGEERQPRAAAIRSVINQGPHVSEEAADRVMDMAFILESAAIVLQASARRIQIRFVNKEK